MATENGKGYDESKDSTILEVGEIESKDDKIVVRIMAYNGGALKVAMNRTYYTRKGELRHKAIGRLTEDELKALLPLLNKAKKAFQLPEVNEAKGSDVGDKGEL